MVLLVQGILLFETDYYFYVKVYLSSKLPYKFVSITGKGGWLGGP